MPPLFSTPPFHAASAAAADIDAAADFFIVDAAFSFSRWPLPISRQRHATLVYYCQLTACYDAAFAFRHAYAFAIHIYACCSQPLRQRWPMPRR